MSAPSRRSRRASPAHSFCLTRSASTRSATTSTSAMPRAAPPTSSASTAPETEPDLQRFSPRVTTMTDTILELSQNPLARGIISKAKLPIPMPEKLERPKGAAVERYLDDKRVLYAGSGTSKLTPIVARALTKAGAMPLLTSEVLRDAFAGPSEAYGRHSRVVTLDEAESMEHVHAIVLDATTLNHASELKVLYDVFHGYM